MIEISRFRLVETVPDEEFLEKNAEFQQGFAYQQDGLLRRTVASGLDGEWLAITWWRSMKDAKQSASNAAVSPLAIEFSSLLDSKSIATEYFKELPG
jgi:hypothetical protein